MKDLYPLELKAFRKKKGPDLRITSFRLVTFSGLIVLITMVLEWSFESHHFFNDLKLIGGVGLIVGIIWNYFEQETKHLEFIGTTNFHSDGIQFKDSSLSWSNVTSIGTGPIYKENIFNWPLHIGPKYSAGLDAFVQLDNDSKFILCWRLIVSNLDLRGLLKTSI